MYREMFSRFSLVSYPDDATNDAKHYSRTIIAWAPLKKRGGSSTQHKVQYHCSEDMVWRSGKLGRMFFPIPRRGWLG